jgi:hypothetical protein
MNTANFVGKQSVYGYLSNVPGRVLEHNYCPECKSIVIERYGYSRLMEPRR